MKTGTIVAVVGVVVIVLIVGMFVFRPETTEAPTPTPTPQFEDVSDGSDSDLGQFIQELPESTPPGTSPSDEEGAESSPAASPAAAQTATISIDEGGFTPATTTIKAGTTVTFTNNGQADHWPASDVHPTHQILPEFDSKRGLATGETYSYTFTELGRFPMHDHLAPNNTGVIIVE